MPASWPSMPGRLRARNDEPSDLRRAGSGKGDLRIVPLRHGCSSTRAGAHALSQPLRAGYSDMVTVSYTKAVARSRNRWDDGPPGKSRFGRDSKNTTVKQP